jgi:hypothetical protein
MEQNGWLVLFSFSVSQVPFFGKIPPNIGKIPPNVYSIFNWNDGVVILLQIRNGKS